jgi:hypothetical protein
VKSNSKANKAKTRRGKIREAWLRGRLNYKLHSGQKIIEEKARESKSQLFVGEIARQFGKSFWLAKKALEQGFKKKKSKIKYGTAFQTDLVEFILPAFDAVLEDCPEDLKPVFKRSGSKFVFKNGSEIKLVGLDRKPNGLRGTVIDLIILDEAGFMSRLDYIYKSVIIPATTHRPNCRILVFSTPPDTPAHEFLDYVEKAEYEGGYLKLTIYHNPMVDEKTIARLMKESGGPQSTTWRREYLCEHVTDANLAIISEWKDEFVLDIAKDHYYPFYHKYQSMDLGVRDNTAVIFGYYSYLTGRLIIEDEYVINGPELTTLVLHDAISRTEKKLWKESKVYRRVSDNNNPLLLQDLSIIHGMHFLGTDKGSLEEMVNVVKMMVQTGSIIVHPRCKQLRGSLKYGVWDKHRQKFAKSKVYGHFDALAALIYLVRNLDKVTNPIPADFQVDHRNQILFLKKLESPGAQAIKNAFARR